MALFKHKVTGAIVERPAHYATHPVFGRNLEPISDKETAAAPKAKETPTVIEPVAEPVIEEVQGGAKWDFTAPEELTAPEETIENNEEN